jgi:hypothetical protein
MPAPSTLGTFLRAFTFGHVRQLDRVLGETLKRAWNAGGGPGEERLTIDVDSFVGEVHGHDKQGAARSAPFVAEAADGDLAQRDGAPADGDVLFTDLGL